MTDNGTSGHAIAADSSASPSSDPLGFLEQRVRRLEDAVEQLQDTGPLEDRVVERLTSRNNFPLVPVADKAPVPVVVMPTPEPPVAVAQPLPTAIPVVSAPPLSPTTWLGFLYDLWAEVKSMAFMYFDRRYRMRWTSYVIPPLLFAAIMTSIFWFPGLSWVYNVTPLGGTLLNVPVVLFMGYFLYRLMTWEAKRYRDAVAGLPRTPRL